MNVSFSNSTNSTRPDITIGKVFFGIILGSINLLVLGGNCLVIAAVVTTRRLRTVTNQYVVSLAAADLLMSILVLPLAIPYEISGEWPFSAPLCKTWLSLDILLCTASICNLCCISLDRYLAVTRPLVYATRRTRTLARGMIAIVWLLSALITFPSMLDWSHNTWGNQGFCGISLDKGYRVYSALGSFFAPFTVMIFVYCSIFWVAHQRKHIQMVQQFGRRRPYNTSMSSTQGKFAQQQFSQQPECSPSSSKRCQALCFPPNSSSSRTSQEEVRTNGTGARIAVINDNHHHHHHHHHHQQPSSYSDERPQQASALAQLLYDSRALASFTAIPVRCVQFAKASKQVRFLEQEERKQKERAAFRREHKTAKTLAMVVGCFSVCWLPFFIVYLIEPFCSGPVNPNIFGVVTWLGYINSIFNPFIYAFYNKEYAAAFSRLLCLNRCRKL